MDTETTYAQLIEDLARRLGADASGLGPESIMEFEHEELVARVFLHPNAPAVILEAEVCDVDVQAEPAVQAMGLRFLHELNEAARFSHGVVACISAQGQLLASSNLPLVSTDTDTLMGALDHFLDVSSDLRKLWNNASWSSIQQPDSMALLNATRA